METFEGVDVSDLILRRSYSRAVKVLRARVAAEPDKTYLRQQLADVLLLDGRKGDALPVLHALANEFARDGFVAKAIAILKKIQRLDPSELGIDASLARLIKERDAQEARRAAVYGTPASLETLASKAAASLASTPVPRGNSAREPFTLEIDTGTLAGSPPLSPRVGLSRTPLFSDLDAGELIAVMDGLRLVTFEAGDIIVSEGEPGFSMFVLSTGTAKAWVRDAAGKAHPIREMTDGDFFGEVSILTGRTRTATVTAATHCDLLELDQEAVRTVGRTYPRVNQLLTDFCRERVGDPRVETIRRQGAD